MATRRTNGESYWPMRIMVIAPRNREGAASRPTLNGQASALPTSFKLGYRLREPEERHEPPEAYRRQRPRDRPARADLLPAVANLARADAGEGRARLDGHDQRAVRL